MLTYLAYPEFGRPTDPQVLRLAHEYHLFRTAAAMGVPPWELAARPTWWGDRFLFHAGVAAEVATERARPQ